MMKLLKDLGCDMNEHNSADTLTSNTALSRPATALGVQTSQPKPKKQTRPASTAPMKKNAKVTRMKSQATTQNQYASQVADLVPQDDPEFVNVSSYEKYKAPTKVPFHTYASEQYPSPVPSSSTTEFQPFRTTIAPAVLAPLQSGLPTYEPESREALLKISETLARMPPPVHTPWSDPSVATSVPAAAFDEAVSEMPSSNHNVQSPPFELIENAILQPGLENFKNLGDNRRHDIIELGIKECLQDDNFIQFCQDLWGMWPRIGLDLKLQSSNLQ
jgi:hypothetical protein